MIKVTIKGMNVLKGLDKTTPEVIKAIQVGIEEGGAPIVKAAAVENTPKQSGRLSRSGSVKKSPDSVGALVIFDVPYALAVHENAGSKGFKFLERAADANIPLYLVATARRAQSELGS